MLPCKKNRLVMKNLNFGQAIEAAKQGKKNCKRRLEW